MQTYLTRADVAKVLGVVPATVRQMEQRGVLKAAAQTEGGIRLFTRSEVERLARKRAKKGVRDAQ